ncbi:MAG: ATP-binding cassette domain-containing protein, partial [Chloroflexi bacterium]|nr:ATP-binding cassette domain-containing protein [Chloroflexota bacterium]
MPTLVEAVSLTKHYGSTVALESVEFQIGEGITGLLGPNGAGKSTAIKLMLGLLRPTAGSVVVMGEKPYESVQVRRRLGYMPEHDRLPTAITASEFLTHMAQVSCFCVLGSKRLSLWVPKAATIPRVVRHSRVGSAPKPSLWRGRARPPRHAHLKVIRRSISGGVQLDEGGRCRDGDCYLLPAHCPTPAADGRAVA